MDQEPDFGALIGEMAKMLDLPLEEAYREGVIFHLSTASKIASHVLAFEVEDDAEPAPVFEA